MKDGIITTKHLDGGDMKKINSDISKKVSFFFLSKLTLTLLLVLAISAIILLSGCSSAKLTPEEAEKAATDFVASNVHFNVPTEDVSITVLESAYRDHRWTVLVKAMTHTPEGEKKNGIVVVVNDRTGEAMNNIMKFDIDAYDKKQQYK